MTTEQSPVSTPSVYISIDDTSDNEAIEDAQIVAHPTDECNRQIALQQESDELQLQLPLRLAITYNEEQRYDEEDIQEPDFKEFDDDGTELENEEDSSEADVDDVRIDSSS